MPRRLLLPIASELDLLHWPNLYHLRDRFHVSITAMTKRLQYLKVLYIMDGNLYASEEDALGMQQLL